VLRFPRGLDAGDLATTTDPLGHTTTRTYDTVSRLLMQTDPLARVLRERSSRRTRAKQKPSALGPLRARARMAPGGRESRQSSADATDQRRRITREGPLAGIAGARGLCRRAVVRRRVTGPQIPKSIQRLPGGRLVC